MILFIKILLIFTFMVYLIFEFGPKTEIKGDTLIRTLLCLSIINLGTTFFLVL